MRWASFVSLLLGSGGAAGLCLACRGTAPRPRASFARASGALPSFIPRTESDGAGIRCAQLVVVLVGIPGSGKSTFWQKMIDMSGGESGGWTRICQDELGTRKVCVRLAERALRSGRNVLIDRCNVDASQRAHWLKLKPAPAQTLSVYLEVPSSAAFERVRSRASHEGDVDANMEVDKLGKIIRRFSRTLVPPSTKEGFDSVAVVRNERERDYAVRMLCRLGRDADADDGIDVGAPFRAEPGATPRAGVGDVDRPSRADGADEAPAASTDPPFQLLGAPPARASADDDRHPAPSARVRRAPRRPRRSRRSGDRSASNGGP